MKKTTFDIPTDQAFEQDTLFIEINECNSRVTEGMAYAKVLGSLVVFSQFDKLQYGYFNKRIQTADHELTKNLFFFDIDTNALNSPARMQNLSERRTRFVYLYSGQYDPENGQLTSLTFEEDL